MAKITLVPITSGLETQTQINNNFAAIAEELNDKVLYKSPPVGEPNTLEENVDVNSKNLVNVNTIAAQAITIAGQSIVAGDTLTIPSAVNVPNVPSGTIAATDVQAALNEIITDMASSAGAVNVGNTPAGNIVATTVQAAIDELDTQDALKLVIANNLSDVADAATARSNLDVYSTQVSNPSGMVQYFAMSTAPTGWMKANGAAVSRTTYATLFTAIGTVFGVGDGSTTFNLPDLRGEFIRGWDDGKGTDTGRVFGSSQADEFKSHTHTIYDGDSTADGAYFDAASGSIQRTNTTNATGGTETRPRNIALLACIKY